MKQPVLSLLENFIGAATWFISPLCCQGSTANAKVAGRFDIGKVSLCYSFRTRKCWQCRNFGRNNSQEVLVHLSYCAACAWNPMQTL
jgi:hypothetical protein